MPSAFRASGTNRTSKVGAQGEGVPLFEAVEKPACGGFDAVEVAAGEADGVFPVAPGVVDGVEQVAAPAGVEVVRGRVAVAVEAKDGPVGVDVAQEDEVGPGRFRHVAVGDNRHPGAGEVMDLFLDRFGQGGVAAAGRAHDDGRGPLFLYERGVRVEGFGLFQVFERSLSGRHGGSP